MAQKLSHIDNQGNARMVDVGQKPFQQRIAKAVGFISLSPEALAQVNENNNKKGDVLTVAEIAGVQAAKQTANLIPLCHTLLLSKVTVICKTMPLGVEASCEVKTTGQTGVEMEALTGVSVALLTIYDMCKAVDKKMVISDIKVTNKEKI